MEATLTPTGAEDVSWDLSDLYAGPEDAALAGEQEEARAAAGAFNERYAGHVAELDAAGLAEAVTELERIGSLAERVRTYAYLHFSTDTADPARGALLQRVEEATASLETEILFFRLEWNAVDDARAAELLAGEELQRYRHFLESERRYRPHLLSEPEERILTEKAVSGSTAWGRLYGELLTALRAPYDGREVSLEEVLALLQNPDRDVRKAAAEAVTAALRPGLRTRASAFNALLLDKAIDDRLRGYTHWLAARNLSNETSDEAVEALVEAVVERNDIPQRWYRVKARLLGLDRLRDYDRMAPLSTETSRTSWDEARKTVLGAFADFSSEAGRIATDFFERRWIDAPVRSDKALGAFCATSVPGVHPYVLMNFTGDRRSVFTLAHELGHGVHGALAQPLGALNASPPLTLAETASVFGEALTFRTLLEQEQDPRRRLDLLAGRIEDAIATIHRQIGMNRYEHEVHTRRRNEGELSADALSELWRTTQGAVLGDAVELTEGYETWWSYVPHFVVSPGYVYAYAYGYLFSLAIYRRYERDGEAIVEPYLDLLRAGGSQSPDRLAALVGLDVTQRSLWDDGLEALDALLGEAEEIAASLQP